MIMMSNLKFGNRKLGNQTEVSNFIDRICLIQSHLAIHNLNYSCLLKSDAKLKISKQFLFCVSRIFGKYFPDP